MLICVVCVCEEGASWVRVNFRANPTHNLVRLLAS